MSTVIITPDKTIIIDGKKTFPLMMWDVTNEWDTMVDAGGGPTESASVSINKIKTNFTGQISWFPNTNGVPEPNRVSLLENAGLYWTATLRNKTNFTSQHYIGTQMWEEPDYINRWYLPMCDTVDKSNIPCSHNEIKRQYLIQKDRDPNHPCYLPIMGYASPSSYPSSFKYWQDACDILMSDEWAYNKVCTVRSNATMYYEWSTNMHLTWDIGGNIDSLNIPVWLGIQTLGKPSGFYVLTPEEARLAMFTAITMGAKGLVFWGYKVWNSSTVQHGLVMNPTEFDIINKQVLEIKNLNDILVLPTECLRWEHYKSNNIVSMTGAYDTTVILKWSSTSTSNFTSSNLNWILKNDISTGLKYLIVVNKGNNPTTSTITINSVGTKSAITIGTLGTGNAIYGRRINIVNGKFTDTIDAHSVNIYKIEASSPCPQSQCNFIITQ